MSPAPRSPVPILLYHSVSDIRAAGQEELTVSPAAFGEHVRAIADSGRSAMTIGALAGALRGDREMPERPVLVTFDDGFADVRPAVEALLTAGSAATVFVTSGSLGEEAMLTSSGLRELAALGPGVEIGAHSVTHPRLDEIPLALAAEEISGSKEAIEAAAQIPIESFAYPHGAHDRRVREAVIEAGFRAAAAVKNALSHTADDPYALARVTMTSSTGSEHVEELLAGSGAPIAWRGERLRTRGYRSLRRLRRRLGPATGNVRG
jgi:peptidoglycan/xylan/chitin deacetylase (PgdA/CDA1 family)